MPQKKMKEKNASHCMCVCVCKYCVYQSITYLKFISKTKNVIDNINIKFYKYIPFTKKSASCEYGAFPPRRIRLRTTVARHPTSTIIAIIITVPVFFFNDKTNHTFREIKC